MDEFLKDIPEEFKKGNFSSEESVFNAMDEKEWMPISQNSGQKAEQQTEQNIKQPVVCRETGIRSFHINAIDSSIEFIRTDSNTLTVSLSRPLTMKEQMTYDIVTEKNGDDISVSVKTKNKLGMGFIRFTPFNFIVEVPMELKELSASTVSGSIYGILECSEFDINNISGTTKIFTAKKCVGHSDTISGNVELHLLSDTGCQINASTMSGSVKIMTDQHVEWESKMNYYKISITKD